MLPMIRVTIHLMDDPEDVLVSETEHDLTVYRDLGDRLKAFAMVGGVRLPVVLEPNVLEAWFAKERAEAAV